MTNVAAFDLGTKNFAFAVSYNKDFIALKNVRLDDTLSKSDLSKQKKQDLIELMSNLNISNTSKIKKKEMVDLISSKIKSNKSKNKPDLCLLLVEEMNYNKNFWDLCDVFLIERQMTTNLQALKLSHYLEMYLKIYYPYKKILNYNASIKTKKLGGTNLPTKEARKKWVVQYVSNILKDENLKYFQALEKKDDVADAICMIQSYKVS
jgi:hypothetical protein